MTSMDAEHIGDWWLPEREDRRIPGILKISPEGKCLLQLLGEMRPWHELGDVTHQPGGTVRTVTSQHLDDAGRYPRIHGQVGVTEWTLENCAQVHQQRNLMGGLPHEEWSVQVAYKGCWYEQEVEPAGDRLLARMQWLSHWVGSRIEVIEEIDPETRRLSGHSIAVRCRPTECAQVDDHCDLL